jgi:hypothetical protein
MGGSWPASSQGKSIYSVYNPNIFNLKKKFIFYHGPGWAHHARRQAAETSVQSVLPNKTPLQNDLNASALTTLPLARYKTGFVEKKMSELQTVLLLL